MKDLLKDLLAAINLEISESPLSDRNLTEKQVLKEIHKLSLLNTDGILFSGEDANTFEINLEDYARNRFNYSFKQGVAPVAGFIASEFDYIAEMMNSMLILIDKLLNPDRYTNIKKDDLMQVIANRSEKLNFMISATNKDLFRILLDYREGHGVPDGELSNIFTTEAAIDFGISDTGDEERYGRMGVSMILVPYHSEPISDEEFIRRILQRSYVESGIFNEMLIFRFSLNVTLPDILENETRKQMFIYVLLTLIFSTYLLEAGGIPNEKEDPYESNCFGHHKMEGYRYSFLGNRYITSINSSFKIYLTHAFTFLVMRKYFSLTFRDLIMLFEDIVKLGYDLEISEKDIKDFYCEVNEDEDKDSVSSSFAESENNIDLLNATKAYPLADDADIRALKKINETIAINPVEFPMGLDPKVNTNSIRLAIVKYGLEKLFNINQ